ncbi:MAG: hypothetical protein J6B32_04630, partial [Spirochaetaceae bacterium]|nr:hypothetical protein [Spirochaetaceae bacterium]
SYHFFYILSSFCIRRPKKSPSLGIDPETCLNNQMVNVISETDLLTKSKLNKSIFSQDYGRELV